MTDTLATLLVAGGGVALGGGAGALVARMWRASRPAGRAAAVPTAADAAARLLATARAEAEALVREADISAREQVLAARAEAEASFRAEEERLALLATTLVAREADVTA